MSTENEETSNAVVESNATPPEADAPPAMPDAHHDIHHVEAPAEASATAASEPAEPPVKRGRKKKTEAVIGDVVHVPPPPQPASEPPTPETDARTVGQHLSDIVKERVTGSAEKETVLRVTDVTGNAEPEAAAKLPDPEETSQVAPANQVVPPLPNRKQRLAMEAMKRRMAKNTGMPKVPLSRIKVPKGFRGR